MTTIGGIQDRLDIAALHLLESAPGPAYDTLTSVLNLEPNHPTALKLRAETALRLYDKRRETALDDIEAALRVNANSGALYLLQNQILLSRNEYSEANKRLKKALFCVFHDDPQLAELRDLYEWQSVKELNYLVTMPTEVIYHILRQLPFKYRVRCLAVSRRWRDTFRSIPDLWRDPDYIECRNSRSASIAQSLATLIKWTDLRTLSVSLTTPVIEALVREKCRTLTQVCFAHGDHVDQLVLQLAMRDIGSTWRKVEIDNTIDVAFFFYAAAMYCPALTELVIHFGRWIHSLSPTMQSLMKPLKVTKLSLLHCDIYSRTLINAVSLCPDVVDLTVQDNQLITFQSRSFDDMLRAAKNLKRLTLRCPSLVITAMQNNNLDTFFRALPFNRLDVLDIQGFQLTRENLLRFADEMHTGMLICCGESFAMQDRPERNRFKNVVKESFRDIVVPQPRLIRSHMIEIGSDDEDDESYEERIDRYLMEDYAPGLYY
ncbi:hypothetical protein BJV82DRAFT_180778 [Fennellomyces sp. T-0311]|nr:hypothetical protein BJV82DRAFT_180778 [Fennellomyces sp. T-0311]